MLRLGGANKDTGITQAGDYEKEQRTRESGILHITWQPREVQRHLSAWRMGVYTNTNSKRYTIMNSVDIVRKTNIKSQTLHLIYLLPPLQFITLLVLIRHRKRLTLSFTSAVLAWLPDW